MLDSIFTVIELRNHGNSIKFHGSPQLIRMSFIHKLVRTHNLQMFLILRTNYVIHTATIYIVQLSEILLFFSILFYVIWSRSDRVTVFSFRIANMTCCDDISDDVRRSSSEPQLGLRRASLHVIAQSSILAEIKISTQLRQFWSK